MHDTFNTKTIIYLLFYLAMHFLNIIFFIIKLVLKTVYKMVNSDGVLNLTNNL